MGIKTLGRFTYDSSTAAAIAAGETVPIPTSTTSNRCVSCDGYNVTINRSGVYQILVNLTFAATGAGPIETILYRNGNAIAGAHALSTAAAAGDFAAQAISTIITVPANSPTATFNLRETYATTLRIANVVVIKVA